MKQGKTHLILLNDFHVMAALAATGKPYKVCTSTAVTLGAPMPKTKPEPTYRDPSNIAKQIHDRDGVEIYWFIAETCRNIFKDCMAENDFCLQYSSYNMIIFGGTNRILWDPVKGFRPDHGYCTADFIRRFEAWRLKNT